MKFSDRTSRFFSCVLHVVTSCFASNLPPEEENNFCDSPFIHTAKAPYAPSYFSEECNEMELRNASRDLEKAIKRLEETQQELQLQMVPMTSALVLHPDFGSRSVYSDSMEMEYADEEIDISGLAPPKQKARNWQVKNVRMFMQERESEPERKKGIFRRMAARFGRL